MITEADRAVKRTLKDENQPIVYIDQVGQDQRQQPVAHHESLVVLRLHHHRHKHAQASCGGEIKYNSGKDDETIDLHTMKALTVS